MHVDQRGLRLLCECNRVLARAANERECLRRLCETLVLSGGYQTAWAGLVLESASREYRFVEGVGHPETVENEQTPRPMGDGAAQDGVRQALATGGPVVLPAKSGGDAPAPETRRATATACAALPVIHAGRILGVLSLQSDASEAFGLSEMACLTELCSDVAAALTAWRARAEPAAQLSGFQTGVDWNTGILDAAKDGFWGVDAEGRTTFVNERIEQMLGHRRHEIMGRPYFDFMEEEDLPEARRHFERRRRGIMDLHDVRFRRRDGSHLWTITSSKSLFSETGEFTGALSLYMDVTESRDMQEKLARQQREQRVIFNSVPAMIWFKDADNRILRANKAAAEAAGMSAEELEGALVGDLYPAADAEKYHRDDLEVIGSGVPKLGIIETIRTPSNETRWIQTDKIPYRDEQGGIIGVIVFAQDITLRMEAVTELRGSEARMQALLRALPDLLLLQDGRGMILDCHAPERHAFHPAPASLIGCGLEDTLPPDLVRLTNELLRQALRTGSPQAIEYSLKSSAATRHFEARMVACGADLVLTIVRDVTERRKTEEELRESEALFRTVTDDLPDPLFLVDLDDPDMRGRIIHANAVAADMHGWSVRELIGMTIADLATPESVAEAPAHIQRMLTSEDKIVFEGMHRRRDGSVFPVEVSSRIIRYRGRRIIIGLDRDISERRRVEQERFEREAFLSSIFSGVEACIFVAGIEEDGRILCEGINPAVEALIGARSEDVRGRELERLGPNVPAATIASLRHSIDHCVEQARPIVFEDSISVAGVETWWVVRLTPLRAGSGRIHRVIGIGDSITDRKMAEEERRRMESQLQHTQKLESLGVLAGGVAHDFNNLLAGIMGNAGLAMMRCGVDSPIRPMLEQIETTASRMADLTRQLLAYSGRGKFVVRIVDVNTLAREMTDLLKISISKRAVLHLNLSSMPALIEADVTQIRQVLMNLITNASESLGERDGEINVSTGIVQARRADFADIVWHRELDDGSYVLLEVADTGEGMAPETLKRIFDPFFTTKFTGRGLGLAAVQGIVRSHRGAIRVFSAPGGGTIFRVYYPAAAGAVPSDVVAEPPSRPWRGRGLVLVIDDEEIVRNVVGDILRSLGFDVLLACDGREGADLFALRADEIAIVLLDMTLPRLSGEETFIEIKKCSPDARIMLMSGYNEQEATSRFAGKDLAGFLSKPFRPRDLMQKLREILPPEPMDGMPRTKI